MIYAYVTIYVTC